MKPESDGKVWNRYGLSEAEWDALGIGERVVHYNRTKACEHIANIHEWPPDLRDSYSRDPYFHTAHMDPCKRWGIKPPGRWAIECNCQMCLGNFGLTDEDKPRKVNEDAVRDKWQRRFNLPPAGQE